MAMQQIPLVYIIVLNWNGWKDTVECLHSLRELRYERFDIVVVDNASTDQSVSKIRNEFPKLFILELDENEGYAAGNNAGMRYAIKRGADYLWILNNDTVVDKGALQPLVDKMRSDSSLGICGSRLMYYYDPDRIQALGGGKFYPWIGYTKNYGKDQPAHAPPDTPGIEGNLDFINGASMFVSRLFVEDTGLLAEDYFLYYEEIDWSLRAKKKYRLGFAAQSLVYHKEGASTKATDRFVNDKSRRADYYAIKNRLRITYKFNPLYLPVVYLVSVYAIFNRMRRKQWDRVPMILKLFVTFNDSKRYRDY